MEQSQPSLIDYLKLWLELVPTEQAILQTFEWSLLEHLHHGMLDGRMMALRDVVEAAKALGIDKLSQWKEASKSGSARARQGRGSHDSRA